MGYMVRIDAKDADAIGEEVQAGPSLEEQTGKSLSEHKAILRACRKMDVEEAVQQLHRHLEASIERLRKELETT